MPVKESDRRPGPFPYYGASGIVDRVDRYIFDGEYLLIAEDGENLRTRNTPVAFLARGRFWVNNHAHVVQGNEKASTQFLAYALTVTDIGSYLTGSTMPKLTQANMNRLPVMAPPRTIQDAIVRVLRPLDDKIELNRQMNETLEAMARALFKSWFVDFDPVRAKMAGRAPFGMDAATAALFPGTVDAVVDSWPSVPLSEFFDLDKGVSYKGEHLVEGGAPMVNLGCFRGDGAFDAGRVKGYAGEVRDRHWVRGGDLVLANTDMTQNRVILGSPGLVPGGQESRYLFSHHVFAARFRDESEALKLYCYYALLQPDFRQRAAGFATGTTVLALPRDAVLRLKVMRPPTALLRQFHAVVRPFRDRIAAGERESRTLAELRDLLLPKLLSGELRIREAERAVEAAL